MNKILKSCLRILWMLLAIILLAGLIWAWIHRDSWVYDINYYLIVYILLLVVYYVLIYKTFRPQKWYNRILVFVLSIVLIFLIFMVFDVILRLRSGHGFPVDENSWVINEIISIVLSIYIVTLIRAHKIEDIVRKKRLQIITLILLPFMLIWAWAWLTRAWAISNRLNINFLEPQVNWIGWCSWYFIGPWWERMAICVEKPIIYFYPTEEIEVNVTLGNPNNLSHTYPKYNSEKWRNVIANPNGDLEDMDTWRKLYALYREWKTYAEDSFEEWFVVKWEDTIPFLEEKLTILWLNEREAEEFIVYWLPQMENNEYNLIRFETKGEQDENMPLNITPTPDTVIRVMMDWKAIDELIDIPEQQLITPERTWFTVVEWWGSQRNWKFKW